jgi:hypothetical protein
MQIPCVRAQAGFVDPALRLEKCVPASMVWDEHGGMFILRVEDLEVAAGAANGPDAGLRLEIPLSPEDFAGDLAEFAARHELPLEATPSGELEATAVLAACHLPGENLFIFAEDPTLTAQKRGPNLSITVSGDFKARRVPCRETDLVIHLSREAMARLIAATLSLIREG